MKQFLLLFILISNFSFSQQFSQVATTIPVATYSDYNIADFDKDGDMDVFVSGSISNVFSSRIYVNNGGTYNLNPGSLTGVNNGFSSWVDYDKDGDLDLFYCGVNSSYNPVSLLYKNNSGVFALQTTGITAFSDGTCSWADYDLDGDMDLFISGSTSSSGGAGPKTRIYQNNSGTFLELDIAISEIAKSSSWADYDKDGDEDLVIVTTSNLVQLYNNTNGIFSLSTYSFANGSSVGNLEWYDIDQNGFLDLIYNGITYVKIYTNTNGNFVDANTNIASGSSIRMADFDHDGDADMLRHSNSAALSIFTNNAGIFSSTAILKTFAGTNGNTQNAYITDLNNDSKIDVFIVIGSATCVVQRNDNTAIIVEPNIVTNISANVNANTAILQWNFTSDNATTKLSYNVRIGTQMYLDNVLSDNADSLTSERLLLQNGNAYLDTFKIIESLPTGRYYYQVQAIDAGYLASAFSQVDSFDILVPSIPQQVYPSYNQSNIPFEFFFTWNPIVNANSYSIDVSTDSSFSNLIVNNALTTDTFFGVTGLLLNEKYFWRIRSQNVFGMSSYSSVWPFRTYFPFYESSVGISGVYTGETDFGDYDNDGDIDFLIAGRTSNTASTTTIRNKFGNTYSNTTISFIQGCIGATAKFFDYDNDDDLDGFVMGREITNSNYNYSRTIVNLGTQLGSTAFEPNNLGLLDGSIDFADFNNDGTLDVAMFGKDAPYNYPKGYYFKKEIGGTYTLVDTLVGLRYSSNAWGDYDNDGDADLIACGESNGGLIRTILYKNVNGILVEDTSQNFIGVYNSDANWGDFDNDGDLDLLIGGTANPFSNSNTRIYENNNGIFTIYNQDLPICYGGAVDWIDYDSDGDLDVFIARNGIYNVIIGEGSTIAINNNGVFTQKPSGVNAPSDCRISWADYDDDGDPDLLVVGTTGTSSNVPYGRLYFNRTVSDTNYINTNPNPPTLVSASSIGTSVSINWNNGSDTQTPAVALTYNVIVGDNPYYDNYASSHSNRLSGFNRVSEMGTSFLAHSKTIHNLPYGNYFYCVQSVDQQYKGSSWKLDSVYVINPSAPTLCYPYQTQLNLPINIQLKWKPFNNATSYDLEIARDSMFTQPFFNQIGIVDTFKLVNNFYNHNRFWWRVKAHLNSGSVTPYSLSWNFFVNVQPILSSLSLPGTNFNDFDFGDIDNDGDKDYLIVNAIGGQNQVMVLRNNLTGFDTVYTHGLNYSQYGFSCKFGDVDSDNDLDFIVSGCTPSAPCLYLNNNGTFTPDNSFYLPSLHDGSIDFGDYDNDGDPDLLVTGIAAALQGYTYGYPKLYRNDAGVFIGLDLPISNETESDGKFVDIDNDGDLDLSIIGSSGIPVSGNFGKRIYRNDVDSFAAMPNIFPSNYLSRGSLSWADYDMDGDMDVVLLAQQANEWPIQIYRNDGNFSFTRVFSDTSLIVNYGEAQWGDYDNDGDPDVFYSGINSGLGKAVNIIQNNEGVFSSIDENFLELSYCRTEMVDIDNDHDLDLFYSGTTSTTSPNQVTYLYLNQSAPNTPPTIPQNLGMTLDTLNTIHLSWNAASDNQTTNSGLSYNVSVYSSTPPYLVSPMASENQNYLYIPWHGNAGLDTHYFLKNIPQGNYSFKVQAVDNTFESSPWSDEYSFLFEPLNNMGIENSDIQIYPNPTCDKIYMEEKSGDKVESLKLFDGLGNLLLKVNSSRSIDISTYSNGVYFIECKTKLSTKRVKIIKQ